MQHAHQLAPLHGYAVNGDAGAEAFGHAAIERGVALRFDLADQPALRAVPVDEDRDFELRLRLLRRVERRQDFASGVVVLQVERGDQDALLRLRDQREDRFAVIDRTVQRLHLAGGNRQAGHLGQRLAGARASAQTVPGRGQAGNAAAGTDFLYEFHAPDYTDRGREGDRAGNRRARLPRFS